MTAETDLLPLPEIERWRVTGDYAYPTEVDPEGGAVDYDAHIAAMQAYARTNVAHATAPLQAEVEALRAEVDMLRGKVDEAVVELLCRKARAERLAEALRRYRNEVPIGHQPHMLAHEVDDLLREQESE